jgi:hypothetical protein
MLAQVRNQRAQMEGRGGAGAARLRAQLDAQINAAVAGPYYTRPLCSLSRFCH